MKTIRVRYTFEVTQTVNISMSDKPDHYSEEEWEYQIIQNAGDQIEFALDGNINWHFQKL